jgi:hypothetical protein
MAIVLSKMDCNVVIEGLPAGSPAGKESEMNDIEVVARTHVMAAESLDHETFDKWVAVRDQLYKTRRSLNGIRECGYCDGTGRMVRDPDIGTDQECFVCEGSGMVHNV